MRAGMEPGQVTESLRPDRCTSRPLDFREMLGPPPVLRTPVHLFSGWSLQTFPSSLTPTQSSPSSQDPPLPKAVLHQPRVLWPGDNAQAVTQLVGLPGRPLGLHSP